MSNGYAGLINIDLAAGSGGTSDSTKALQSATTTINISAATAPNVGEVLTATSGTAATWQAAGGGAEFTATDQTGNYTASSGDWVVFSLTTAGATLTLPATPTQGDAVKVTLASEATDEVTNYVAIARNGSSINGGTAAEFETFNILWKSGDTVTFRCTSSNAWVTSDRCIQNRFMARAYSSSGMTNLTADTITKVTMDGETYDYNGDYDPTTNYRYTAPITGTYQINAVINMNQCITGQRAYLFVFEGGTGGTTIAQVFNSYATQAGICLNMSDTYELAAGEYVEVFTRATSGNGTQDIQSGSQSTYFSIGLVGSKGSSGGGGGDGTLNTTTTKTAAYTAVAGEEVLCDTNAAAGDFDITMPASPSVGDVVRIVLITDHATRDVKIDRNSSNWMGSTTANVEDKYMLCLEGDSVTVKYMGGGVGWSVIEDSIQSHNARMRPNTQTASMPNGNLVQLVYDTSVYDIGGLIDLANEKFTVRRPGIYQIGLGYSLAFTVSGSKQEAFIQTTTDGYILQDTKYAFGSDVSNIVNSIAYEVPEGDDITFNGRQNNGTTLTSRTDLNSCFATISELR